VRLQDEIPVLSHTPPKKKEGKKNDEKEILTNKTSWSSILKIIMFCKK
jgi:hypothetical protein